jgi:site-specific DNA recombinase
MKAALGGQHDWVGVWKLDRFGRSVLHLKDCLAQLDDAHVRFASITQGIDTDPALHNSMGRMMLNFLAMIAEFERDTLIERVNAGRMVRFADGKPDSWNLVYGFKPGKPEIDEPKAELMRRFFQWRFEEYSVYELEELVSDYAAQHGLGPPRGKRWWAKTMMNWLKSRQYIGEYARRSNKNEEATIFEIPRIISDELFYAVQEKMEATRRKHEGNPDHKYAWTGFLFSEHDRPMGGLRDHEIEYYRCADAHRRSKVQPFERCPCPYLRASALEPVWDALWALLNDPAMQRAQALAYAAAEDAGKPARGRDAREKLKAAKATEQRIIDNYRDGDITREVKLRQLAELREEMQGYEAEVRAMGKIVEIAARSTYERACAERAKMREPKANDARRVVLEGIRDLKVRLQGDYAAVTGQIPIASENCEDRLTSLHSSHAILSPFTLRVKLAA